ncbi:unnamed protein product, partial [Amoebophrya sp. A120]
QKIVQYFFATVIENGAKTQKKRASASSSTEQRIFISPSRIGRRREPCAAHGACSRSPATCRYLTSKFSIMQPSRKQSQAKFGILVFSEPKLCGLLFRCTSKNGKKPITTYRSKRPDQKEKPQ